MTRPLKEPLHHFPFKLHDMLEYAADTEYSSAVSWVEEGNAFSIHDKVTFMNLIVPMFFKQTKFRSFTRQLNIWGFKRSSTDGPTKGAWRHEHFVRGSVDSLRSIERVEVKNDKSKTVQSSQPKKGKPKLRRSRSTCKEKRARIRNASPAESSDDSPSSNFEAKVILPSPPIPSTPICTIAIPENAATQAMVQPFSPNDTLQSQPHLQPHTMWHTSSHVQHNGIAEQSNQQSMQEFNGNTNEDDLLFLLSGIFDSDVSSHDDDLSSILSLNEASEDFMNRISF
ncbi:hypothetical protein ACHAXR_002539 [Thalassiosira sp. AJA248-18]